MHKKGKIEKYAEYHYFGPFTLLEKLKLLHKNELPSLTLRKNTSDSFKISGLLNEINPSVNTSKVLQFDVKKLFSDHKELFWNLVYRFISDGKDYYFMIPYEADFIESEPDDNEELHAHLSSRSSESDSPVDQDRKGASSYGERTEHQSEINRKKSTRVKQPNLDLDRKITTRPSMDHYSSVAPKLKSKSSMHYPARRQSRKSF